MSLTAFSSHRLKRRAKTNRHAKVISGLWLIMALLVAVATLVVWIFSEAPTLQSQKYVTKIDDEIPQSNLSNIRKVDDINELSEQVKPISFEALLRDLRDYPDEFKDMKYLQEHAGQWTVQVMDVSEHSIITDYLNGREDRNKFAYFRYRDEGNQSRYLLTYDVMSSPQMAMGATKTVDFDLPANVRVIPEEINRYASLIENYEISEPVKDLGLQVREVKLQPTRREIAAQAPRRSTNKPAEENDNESSTSSDDVASRSTESQESIRGSNNTDDTLAVSENSTIITQEQASNTSNSNKINNINTNTTSAGNGVEADETVSNLQKNKGTLKKTASENSEDVSIAPANTERGVSAVNDPIRELIENRE